MDINVNQQSEHRRRSRRVKNGGCAGTVVYVIAVLGISLVLSLVAIFVANDVFAFVADNAEIELVVPENTKVSELSKQLDKLGVISYGTIFSAYTKLTKEDGSVLAGTYMLNPQMDYGQIARSLQNSESTETVTITIPEGYTVGQVKQLLLDNKICTEDALNNAINEYSFKHAFLEDQLPPNENWLEGYLFPDTYELYKGNSTVVGSVNKMLNNFDEKYDAKIKEGAQTQQRSIHEILIIASLIEREAQVDSEYTKIAGVIYNRLRNADAFPFLQIDASVLYGLGRTGGELTTADLQQDTPYNTYTRQGLPAGPICNPGYKSIYAATHPDDHGYFYYVAMPDGSHLFASSNDEHNNNIATASAAAANAQ